MVPQPYKPCIHLTFIMKINSTLAIIEWWPYKHAGKLNTSLTVYHKAEPMMPAFKQSFKNFKSAVLARVHVQAGKTETPTQHPSLTDDVSLCDDVLNYCDFSVAINTIVGYEICRFKKGI